MPIKKHPNIFINKILTGKNDSEGCIRRERMIQRVVFEYLLSILIKTLRHLPPQLVNN